MDPHLLRTFVTVVRRGSFSAAARELGYTQSAVSQHIASLEADLGTVLLFRRPVAPSEAGTRLLEHAGPLLIRLDAARADVMRVAATPNAAITIGASPLAVKPRLSTALADLRRRFPRTHVTVRVLGRQAVLDEVSTGALALGLVDGMAAPSDPLRLPEAAPLTGVVRAAGDDELVAALPLDHPLARRTALRLPDLADARWIDAPEAGLPLAQLRANAEFGGFRPALAYDGTDVAALGALVAGGHGLAVLPRPAAEAAPGVTAVPIAEPRLAHCVEAVHAGALDGPVAGLVKALT
ncbi:LysR family transcriptional regulator [Amycolatopsis albispora]|uniref:LysR family transcriptional regulator n=1 Tax=Amycolatopsis albispora TaxID=1804986 RepID=A0A344L1Q5_9PSEU|nr:LysR family transcriptional regulator [Amycolatopsis albispora]AXB41979.1 LysR family transcriptional regulator [Amycolatopsis albispora]